MNIFITGANGFIGSHLKEYLAKHYIHYKLFTPSSKELDLVDEKAVDKYIHSYKIDIIIHLANRGGGRDTLDMKNVTEYNLRIFFNIVKHEENVKKIISFGSGAEYGKDKPIIDVREDDYLELLPLDEYGFYKSITSRYIQRTRNIVQLRIFGAYGEYENYRYKFITNSIVKNLLHLPIEIVQNVYFDYIDIYDMVPMIAHFIENDGKYKIYNITKGQKVDLVTLAQTINDVSDFKSEIIVKNSGLNFEYTSSNDRIMGEHPFRLSTHRETIRRLIDYYRSNLSQINADEIRGDALAKKIVVAKES